MKKVVILSVLISILASCNGSTATEEENIIVPPGKADDFLSMTAQEYVLQGTSEVVLEDTYLTATEEEKLERAKELIQYKHVVVGWFLNVYLIDKHDSANEEYGGFKSLVKNGAWEDLGIEKVNDLTYSFSFTQLIGGTNDLLTLIPSTMGADGKRYFELTMGKISNYDMSRLETNYEWYRESPWSEFNPSTLSEDRLEKINLAIWPEERSNDAWPDYNALFEDGMVEIALHFGWDYHSSYHEKHSESVYNWLINTMGFASPVATWAEYDRESGPLTKIIKANGKDVSVKVFIYYGKSGTETDPDTNAGGILLENDMRDSFENREVIIYSGHSGPLYGFALANWRKTLEGDLDDSEIPFITLPENKYQVVLAEGCDTYALGEAFMQNPAKEGNRFIDIITTTNSSNASVPTTVMDFIKSIVGTDYRGNHSPRLYSEILKDMDSNSYWFSTMYGVHGIDDNPHGYVWADPSLLCTSCSENSDCNSPGYQCSRLSGEEKVCTYQCTADDGCPEGYFCENSATSGYITTKQCVPAGLSCTDPDVPETYSIIINEILADPASDETGDANGDGVRHFADDEFVELVNTSVESADISGWTLSDGYMVRFVFPEGTVVSPMQPIVIFGGGEISEFNLPENALIFVAQGGLGLNNTGDTVTLADDRSNPMDSYSYGTEGGNDRSLVRSEDANGSSSFIPHSPSLFSPGARTDGTDF
ncbi:MAG: lamin tail domain-containing protein [Deltaproteobacteria bacterium]|nr:lamin tail domain-containing protein [Deltaproteobacteria bacterium]